MKKFKLFAPLSILAMSLVACGGGGDKTPEWAKGLKEKGYTYSEAMPSDETIKAALGLDYFEFPPLANVTGYAFIYNEAQEETETSYGTAQNFNIVIEGDYIEPLSDLLGDFGFEVHAGDGYYWSLDSEREALYEIDFQGLSSLESEDSGEDVDGDSILDELDLARRTVRAEDGEEEAPINYTSITVYCVEDLWTQNRTTDTDWNSDTKTFFSGYGFDLPFMQFGDAYYWDDSYYLYFGFVSMSDYYWIDLTEEYAGILGAEGSGWTYVPGDAEYSGYYEKEDEFGNTVDVILSFDDYGNTLTVYFGHNLKHTGTAEDPLNVSDALYIIEENYYEDILISENEYYVKGIVAGTPRLGNTGDYHFELVDVAGSENSITVYYATPNGFALPAVGDTVTVAGKLQLFEGSSSYTFEVSSGRMIDGTVLEPTKVIVSSTNIKLAAEGSKTITASLDYEPETPTFTAEFEAEWLTVTINGKEITFTVAAGAAIDSTVDVTIKSGELEPAVVTVKVVDPSDVPSDPAPATMTKGNNASDCTVNGQAAIKVGTSKNAGSMTITVPAGTTTLTFYAGAWKGTTVSVNITGATASPASASLVASDVFTGNVTAFTLAEVDAFLVTIELSNITAETSLTLSTSTVKRFVVWGAMYIA